MPGPLGLNKPPDTRHLEKYPFAALPVELQPTGVPVVLGIAWFTSFDSPTKGADGKYRLPTKNLGSIRGGHSPALEPAPEADWPGREQDIASWWAFYDQKAEGACVGFSHARAMSLIFREKFDAFWIYDDARRAEGTYPEGEGSTCRSGGDALVKWGAHYESGELCHRLPWTQNKPGKQIKSYHWCTTVEQVRTALGYPSTVSEFPLLNSWGKAGYPERVLMPDVTLARLLNEEGEAAAFLTK